MRYHSLQTWLSQVYRGHRLESVILIAFLMPS